MNPFTDEGVGAVEKEQAMKEIAALGDELTSLLRQPTLDDVLAYTLASNVKRGKVWANYQLLKDFFEQLKTTERWKTEAVAAIIARVELTRDIDRCLTRLGIGGLVSWTRYAGDDHYYMDEGQIGEVLERFDRMNPEVQDDLEEIGSLYRQLLESRGR